MFLTIYNSTTNKLINYYSNFLIVFLIIFILYTIVKMMTDIEARSFKISKLKNLLEKPSNLLKSLEFVIPHNCTCLRAKSQCEKAKRFTTKFSVNFIVTVHLTF